MPAGKNVPSFERIWSVSSRVTFGSTTMLRSRVLFPAPGRPATTNSARLSREKTG